jgi:hypothetical protein
MKKILTLLLLSISLLGYAQKFQLTDLEGNPYPNEHTISTEISENDLTPSGEYVAEFIVENLTSTNFIVSSMRKDIALPEGMMAFACFGECPFGNPLDIDWEVLKDSSEVYSLHLMPNGCFGLCKFQIDFTAEGQNMTIFIEIDVQHIGVKENNNANVSLSAYPNPVSIGSKVNVSYSIADHNERQNLVIRNIVGAEVMRMPLNPYENNISFDASSLKAGVYFYAIENKNQISIAKKLIVK